MATKKSGNEATGEELVRYTIPYQRGRTEELFGINGKIWRIQRGVEVTIPRYLKEYIEERLAAREAAYRANDEILNDQNIAE